MPRIKGRNLLVFIKNDMDVWKAIAANTSCNIDEKIPLVEKAGSSQSGYTEYMTKAKSWELDTSHLITTENIDTIRQLCGKTVRIMLATTSDSDNARAAQYRTPDLSYYRCGTAICESSTITAKNGNYVNGSFRFLGTSPLDSLSDSIAFVNGYIIENDYILEGAKIKETV